MNNQTYSKDGKQYKRITKTTAKKLFNAGKTIALLPCKANPLSIWFSFYPLNKNSVEHYTDKSFDLFVNNFEYYNCNNQTGRYTAFYTVH